MDGYTFDEGVALLVLVKAPQGVINYLKSTHNRSHLHSEIHKQLRIPGVLRMLKEKGFCREEERGNVPQISSNNTNKECGPDATDNVPENEKSGTDETEDETDPAEIVLTKHDVRTHEHTRYEDMPNDITRELWLQRQDLYREMQQAHLKMRSVPEGEEHNEERAKWRAEVLRLDEEIDKLWALIDAEIERFVNEKEKVEKKSDEKPDFDISTYRSYISKALRKKSLTDAQRVELQHRVDALLKTGVEIKPETLEKLKAVGVKIG